MKHLSRQDIEEIAERLFSLYAGLPENRGTHIYKVDPELFLRKVLGLNIEYMHLSCDGSIMGLTAFEEMEISVTDGVHDEETVRLDGKTVIIESDLNFDSRMYGRRNFTLMHEGSHQIFKMLYPNDYGAVNNGQPSVYCHRITNEHSRHISNWEEWQANVLASAILLPESLVRQGMYLFGLGKYMEYISREYRPQEFTQFSDLAIFLGCSRKALAIRMKQLGLLKRDYIEHPVQMADVY